MSDDNAPIDEAAAILKALADPTRLRLILLLIEKGDRKALCVNALAVRLAISQPAVSQHLRILRGLDLVTAERRGYRVHYSLNRKRLFDYWEQIESVLKIHE